MAAYRLGPLGSDGSCCECAGFVDCDCDTELPCTSLECRTRGGTATLCGYSEFTSPSTPPKKYRTMTHSGERLGIIHNEFPGCVTVFCSFTDTYAGSSIFAEANCAPSSSGTRTRTGSCSSNGVFAFNGINAGNINDTDTIHLTATTRTVTSTLACSFGFRRPSQPTQIDELIDEDTEADAITRLLAGGGGTWSAWTATGDGSGSTCIPSSCCLARWQERTSGFSFAYQEAEFRARITGLTPGAEREVLIQVYRRAYGAGSYELFQTLSYIETADGAGEIEIIDEVPNLLGYETYVSPCTFIPVAA